MFRIVLPLILFAACSQASADVKAVVSGPKEALAGNLVVLSCAESVGDNFAWITPEGLQTLSCGDVKKDLGFAVARAGTYEFVLVAADSEANIAYAKHTVKIVGSLPTQPDPGEPEEPEEPTPTPGLEKIAEQSAALSSALRDPTTTASLRDAILNADKRIVGLCEQGQCPTFQGAMHMMKSAISHALLRRTDLSKDWLNGWREPINESIRQLNPQDVDSYLAVMRAVASGL